MGGLRRMNPSPEEMRLLVARMLPEEIEVRRGSFHWKEHCGERPQVSSREWLFVVHLAEKTLTEDEYTYFVWALKDSLFSAIYARDMCEMVSATTAQRIEALCRVKHPNLFEIK